MAETLGERIKKTRLEAGLTQEELAKAANILPSSLSNYESDRRRPTSANLGKIASKLGVSSDWLLGETKVVARPENPTDLPPEIQKYFRGGKWEALDPNDKKKLIRLIKGFMEEEEEEKG